MISKFDAEDTMKPAPSRRALPSRRRWSRLLLAAALAAAVLAAGQSGRSVAAGEAALTEQGRLDIEFSPDASGIQTNDSGWLLLNSTARRGYMITEERSSGAESSRMWISSFDLDTFQPLRRVELRGLPLWGGKSAFSGQIVAALNEREGRLYLAMTDSDTRVLGAPRTFKKMLVLDERAFNEGRDDWATFWQPPAAHTTQTAGHNLLGITYSPATGDLLLLWESPWVVQVGVYDHWLLAWRGDSGEASWAYPLTSCAASPFRTTGSSHYPLPVLVTEAALFVPCQADGRSATAQVVRIPLQGGRPDLVAGATTTALPRRYADVLADQAGGRLLFRALFEGESWWVFDAKTSAWAGAIGLFGNATGYATSAGIDPASGRFYALVPDFVVNNGGDQLPGKGGLFYSDSRLTPAPQGTNALPDLAYPGLYQIVVDPAGPDRPRRVFVRRGTREQTESVQYPNTLGSAPTPVEGFYRVLRDDIPVAQPADVADLDKLTVDVEERPGVTGANYGGAAAGYGARVRLLGGVSGVTMRDLSNSGSSCFATDRELVAGVVSSTQLSNEIAAATASAAVLDGNSVQDLATPLTRCWPQPSGAQQDPPPGADGFGSAWAEMSASCSSSGQDGDGGPDVGRRGSANAACDFAKGDVAGEASHDLRAVDSAAITVADAKTETRVWRAADGLHTTVKSTARGVVVPGVGTIARVTSESTTVAAGHKKSARATLTRTYCGIETSGADIPECTSDPSEVVRVLNTAFGIRGHATVGEPDPMLLHGSEGGYIAAVQKPGAIEFSDQIVNRDQSKAVPALELVYYNDDGAKGVGRAIVQLAGVAASSTYGIYLLPTEGEYDPPPPDSERSAGKLPPSGGGGDGTTDVDTEPIASDAEPSGGEGTFARLFGRFLLIRSLLEGLLAAACWMALGLPAWFASRRAAYLEAAGGDAA